MPFTAARMFLSFPEEGFQERARVRGFTELRFVWQPTPPRYLVWTSLTAPDVGNMLAGIPTCLEVVERGEQTWGDRIICTLNSPPLPVPP